MEIIDVDLSALGYVLVAIIAVTAAFLFVRRRRR